MLAHSAAHSAAVARKHRPLSVASVDLDIEGGGRIDEHYDTGLPWPLASSAQPLSWSAKGPAAQIPRLGLAHSAKAHLTWARAGWSDANRWPEAIRLIANSSEIRNGILKGLFLSGVIAALVFFLELAFLPTVLFEQPLVASHSDSASVNSPSEALGSLGNVFWLYPLIGGSYLLASSWTTDVAEAAYRLRHGHVRNALSIASFTPPAGTSRRLVRESYRLFLIVNYAAVVVLLGRIPYLGRPLSFLFMSFVDGYYCFEQAWIARGWSLERRTRYCEERWSYFVAFGLPSTAVSFFHPSGLLNLMLFMLVFPFCTVLAMLANPQPRISASGSSSTFSPDPSSAASNHDSTGPLSVFLPGRLPVFWPTIKLHRLVLRTFPALADVPQTATSKAFERSYAYSRVASGGIGIPGGGMGGVGAPSGRTAAQLVGGIWGGGAGASRNLGGGGSPNPSAWSSPQLGGEPNGAGLWGAAPMHPTGHAAAGAAASGYGAYSTSSDSMQTLHSRAGGPLSPSKVQNGAAGPPQAMPPPPPKGKARGNARKLD
ncbi:uncharacterized protein PFL1_00260 [Pseudozyma flocculosa PF-1]|uniref:Uncharacterized protein n=1 Tax=Pseudozyma flocculosa TaxID=84751 RepID=A0A5C3ERY1_9BASI|nr:uncharacterized protein PFL1_00260 [Pseudozyma flocculosa PF-1]EPQ32062.1 hypothetical protein PFL1_00260 [Pseudozyma flocculosa PF-1]SPO35008.1 uncharacterized protein PSFLO_00479 [Pseudozyma flocculosa]